ncbi:hypothetical protein EGJ53_15315 [Pseudomonas fluorescens]|nr:hypothetical protein EGJ53_15315 [Pseudomonas fluorescens]
MYSAQCHVERIALIDLRWTATAVGASLLAKAVGQSACLLDDTPPSRASSLPQVLGGAFKVVARPSSGRGMPLAKSPPGGGTAG